VFAPASEPHLLLLSDSAVRAAEAAAAGGHDPADPEDSQQLRVVQLVQVSYSANMLWFIAGIHDMIVQPAAVAYDMRLLAEAAISCCDHVCLYPA
jgi:hypothetical protein